MNKFDATACTFVSERNRTAFRLPDGGFVVKVAQPDGVVITSFYGASETKVAQSVTRSRNGFTVDEPLMRTMLVEGGLQAAMETAEALAVADMQAIMARAA